MTTLIGTGINPRTDEFLAHHGVKGMKWGVRKSLVTVGGIRRAANDATSRVASVATAVRVPNKSARVAIYNNRVTAGQSMLDRANNRTGRAVLHLAGKQVAESLLFSGGKLATRAIPNASVARGVRASLEVVHLAVTVKNINDGVMLAQAANANKKRRGRR